MQNNCATTSLAPFAPPPAEWTAAKVRHVYRRLGYGATNTQVLAGLQQTPVQLVEQLLQEARNTPIPAAPYWATWTREDYENAEDGEEYENYKSLQREWVRRSFEQPFQAKIALFWHDHFATEKNVYNCNNSMWQYYELLHRRAFGNFRTFVEEMGTNPAMLIYLDGNENIADEPNENYARELMELFTMGEGNGYTQTDIENVARALTGWRMAMYACTPPYFNADLHDNDVKTIFGQSGNFGYDDVHELIFTLRADQTATYICSKLYQQFVYHEPNPEVIAQLATTFKNGNWEIYPVIEQILKSEHFFDESFIGSRIKHPLEMTVNLFSPLDFEIETDVREGFIDYANRTSYEMGMDIFDPPNVAGWSGHRTWLSENALTYRWSFAGTMIRYYLSDTGHEKLRQLALTLANESNDPAVIAAAMAEHWLAIPLSDDLKEVATLFLRAGIPDNYFDDGSWTLYWEEAPSQLANLLSYFIQIPEFQLA